MSGTPSVGDAIRIPSIARYALVVLLGLAFATVHWLGILLGGVLVGSQAPNTGRGILHGGLFGLLVWVVSLGVLGAAGINPMIAGVELLGVSAAIPIALGAIGGSARELRRWLVETVSRG